MITRLISNRGSTLCGLMAAAALGMGACVVDEEQALQDQENEQLGDMEQEVTGDLVDTIALDSSTVEFYQLEAGSILMVERGQGNSESVFAIPNIMNMRPTDIHLMLTSDPVPEALQLAESMISEEHLGHAQPLDMADAKAILAKSVGSAVEKQGPCDPGWFQAAVCANLVGDPISACIPGIFDGPPFDSGNQVSQRVSAAVCPVIGNVGLQLFRNNNLQFASVALQGHNLSAAAFGFLPDQLRARAIPLGFFVFYNFAFSFGF